ncbi:MAG TPA: hypothetical protein PLQ11_08950 [Beijerinckiaceae bacterium]|nr:hypothetical protein [Beijerinckiaceae bacterium]
MVAVLKRWLLMGLVAAAAGVALLVIDPTAALLFRVVGLVGMALFALSIVVMLLTFRRARTLSAWALLFSALSSILCTGLMARFGGVSLATAMMVLSAVAGGLVGIAWALTNLLFVENETVRARGTLWFLAIWALTLLVPQAVALAGARTPQAMMILSFFGMGLALGNSLSLLVRRSLALRLPMARGGSG